MHVPHVIASQELLQGSRCDAAPQVGGVWIAPIYSWYHPSTESPHPSTESPTCPARPRSRMQGPGSGACTKVG